MEHQDWTTVVLKRRNPSQGRSFGVADNERLRLAKMAEIDYAEALKKQVESDSLQTLIRKRMELKLNQEKADLLCHFPRHTFKAIESRRLLPTSTQQQAIQKHLGIQLKIIGA